MLYSVCKESARVAGLPARVRHALRGVQPVRGGRGGLRAREHLPPEMLHLRTMQVSAGAVLSFNSTDGNLVRILASTHSHTHSLSTGCWTCDCDFDPPTWKTLNVFHIQILYWPMAMYIDVCRGMDICTCLLCVFQKKILLGTVGCETFKSFISNKESNVFENFNLKFLIIMKMKCKLNVSTRPRHT